MTAMRVCNSQRNNRIVLLRGQSALRIMQMCALAWMSTLVNACGTIAPASNELAVPVSIPSDAVNDEGRRKERLAVPVADRNLMAQAQDFVCGESCAKINVQEAKIAVADRPEILGSTFRDEAIAPLGSSGFRMSPEEVAARLKMLSPRPAQHQAWIPKDPAPVEGEENYPREPDLYDAVSPQSEDQQGVVQRLWELSAIAKSQKSATAGAGTKPATLSRDTNQFSKREKATAREDASGVRSSVQSSSDIPKPNYAVFGSLPATVPAAGESQIEPGYEQAIEMLRRNAAQSTQRDESSSAVSAFQHRAGQ
jgi:hypothetical protein